MLVGISVVKRVSFRGVQQEFSNVYHYKLETAVTAPDEELLDAVVLTERSLHSTDVTFVRGSVWSAGGTPQQNQMRFEKALTGTGNQTLDGSLDRERAVLAYWPAGVNSRGKPVYLRKWYHSCGACAGVGFAASILQNTSALSETSRNTIANKIDELTKIGSGEAWDLSAESGRMHEVLVGPSVHRFLEHHQLGDAWR